MYLYDTIKLWEKKEFQEKIIALFESPDIKKLGFSFANDLRFIDELSPNYNPANHVVERNKNNRRKSYKNWRNRKRKNKPAYIFAAKFKNVIDIQSIF